MSEEEEWQHRIFVSDGKILMQTKVACFESIEEISLERAGQMIRRMEALSTNLAKAMEIVKKGKECDGKDV